MLKMWIKYTKIPLIQHLIILKSW